MDIRGAYLVAALIALALIGSLSGCATDYARVGAFKSREGRICAAREYGKPGCDSVLIQAGCNGVPFPDVDPARLCR